MVARGAGAAGPVLLACRQWDPLQLARRLPSLGVGAWRSAPLLPWQVQCPVRVCAALAAGSRGSGRYLVLCLSRFPLPAPRVRRCVCWAVPSGCPLPSLAGTPFHAVCAFRVLGPVAFLVVPACPLRVCALALPRCRLPPPWVVWRAHLTRSRHWALVGPFHVVRAPPRVLPRFLAPSGMLRGGRSGPGSPLLGLGLWGWRKGVPGGRPRAGCLPLLRGASGVRRSPSPDCPPSGRAVGVRYPRAVGAGVWVWGPYSVPLACTPCGGCVPRGGSAAFVCRGAGWRGRGGVRPAPRLRGRGGPVGRGVALPRSVFLPSLGRQQSGCHWRRSVHGGHSPPYHSGLCSSAFTGRDLCGVLARWRGLACSPRFLWEPAAGAGGRAALRLPSRAGGGRTIPPASGGGGRGHRGLRAGGGGGGGRGRAAASLLPLWLAASGSPSWPPLVGALPSGLRVRPGSRGRPSVGGDEGRPVDRSPGGPCRPGEYVVVWGREEKLQVVPQVRVHVGGHARLVEYPAWARVAGPLCGLEADRGDLADLRRVVVGHAVKGEGSVSGLGRFYLVPYGVPIVGPSRPDGVGGYGGGPAPVCCSCLGDSACRRLEGGGVVCQVECPEAYGGVQDPGEVVGRLWWDRERALVVGEAYLGRWARCDCNLGGRVASSGLVA